MMKFFAAIGLSIVVSFFIWFTYFGVLFLYADASGRKAAFGFQSGNSDLAASIVAPVVLSALATVISVVFISTEDDL